MRVRHRFLASHSGIARAADRVGATSTRIGSVALELAADDHLGASSVATSASVLLITNSFLNYSFRRVSPTAIQSHHRTGHASPRSLVSRVPPVAGLSVLSAQRDRAARTVGCVRVREVRAVRISSSHTKAARRRVEPLSNPLEAARRVAGPKRGWRGQNNELIVWTAGLISHHNDPCRWCRQVTVHRPADGPNGRRFQCAHDCSL
jgi:hypothetical protein